MASRSCFLVCLSRVLPAVVLTTAIALFGAVAPGRPFACALLAAAAVAAMAAVLSSAGRVARAVRELPSRTGGASGHVDAPTAYWCAVQVPRRPAQPRAPGQR